MVVLYPASYPHLGWDVIAMYRTRIPHHRLWLLMEHCWVTVVWTRLTHLWVHSWFRWHTFWYQWHTTMVYFVLLETIARAYFWAYFLYSQGILCATSLRSTRSLRGTPFYGLCIVLPWLLIAIPLSRIITENKYGWNDKDFAAPTTHTYLL
jgi:hypothetical protein